MPEEHPYEAYGTDNDERHLPAVSLGQDRDGEGSGESTDGCSGVEDGC